MDRLQAMKTFVKVAEHGGFAEAGRSLGMSRRRLPAQLLSWKTP